MHGSSALRKISRRLHDARAAEAQAAKDAARAAGAAEAGVEAPNAGYLRLLVRHLETATYGEAFSAYREMYHAPGCDDWLLAELGRVDLFFLLGWLLRRPDVRHPWIYERVREVEAEPDGCIDLWAREHYKSTIITFGLTIQDILRDPEICVCLLSHDRPSSKAFLKQIKSEFEDNRDLQALYPSVLWHDPKNESPKWSEDEGIVVRREGNPKEATLEAHGLIEGLPTGKHFPLLVYDDVVTETSVTSPEMMAKVAERVSLSYAVGTDDGAKRWVGTRYHFNDAQRTVLDRGTFRPRLHDGTVGNCGDVRRPAFLTPELIAQKRRDMGPYVFACQILQNPRADATQGFQREWVAYWTPDDGRGLNKYILCDPASSKKASADYTVFWVVGLGEDMRYYVLELVRDRLNLTERGAELMRLHRKWKPVREGGVRYEEYGLQADIEHIETVQKDEKYGFEITAVGGIKGKEERIKRLVPLFEQRRILLPASMHRTTRDGTRDLVHDFVEDEYLAFPVAVHDDMLDGLARIEEREGRVTKRHGARVEKERVALALKWPAPRAAPPRAQPWKPKDAGMGY